MSNHISYVAVSYTVSFSRMNTYTFTVGYFEYRECSHHYRQHRLGSPFQKPPLPPKVMLKLTAVTMMTDWVGVIPRFSDLRCRSSQHKPSINIDIYHFILFIFAEIKDVVFFEDSK